jgi:hypothetical protein
VRIVAISVLTKDPSLWADYVTDTLKWATDFIAYEFAGCEESADVVRQNGGTVLDDPIEWLGASDTGTALTTMYLEALKHCGADAVFMADPTEKFIGDIEIVKGLLETVEVVKSKMFWARVTEKDEFDGVYDHPYFEPEFNEKVTFCQCRPGRLFWAMYPFWPYGAMSKASYGMVKNYSLTSSKDTYKILVMGSAAEEQVSQEALDALEKDANDWVAREMKSRSGGSLITEEQFSELGVARAESA